MASITTEVLADIDYVEWHGGVRLYGFWCIQIEEDAWVDRLNSVKSAFHPYLQTDYQRFYHVTIATVGFMNAESWKVVERQVRLLSSLNGEKIDLCWENISSYAHCPVVSVSSLDNSLSKVRESLHSISIGDDSSVFEPHITLGYYSKVLTIENIHMVGLEPDLAALDHLNVGSLQFCTYETDSIKGPISIKHIIELVAKQ